MNNFVHFRGVVLHLKRKLFLEFGFTLNVPDSSVGVKYSSELLLFEDRPSVEVHGETEPHQSNS